MLEKWEKRPATFGAIVGFVAMPLLWWLQSRLIHLAFNPGSPAPLTHTAFYWILGAIPGAICGRGTSLALFAWRQQDARKAKPNLLWHGGVVFLLLALFMAYQVWMWSQLSQLPGIAGNARIKASLLIPSLPLWFNLALIMILRNLPFHCASLMLFIGLFMRSKTSKPA